MMKKFIIVLLVVMMLFSLTACKEYTITFVGMDGEVVAEQAFSKEAIDLPTAPEVDGYRFVGWYLDQQNRDTKLDSEYFVRNRVRSDVTAYAHYDAVSAFDAWPIGETGTCVIRGINVAMTDVVIPEKITITFAGVTADYPVAQIGTGAFEGDEQIESVYIPETVTSISDNAFKGCTNLKTITVPASVSSENVGNDILTDTPSLTHITAPTWVVEYADKDVLVDVTFNAGNTVNAGMFKNASNLQSVKLSDDLEVIAKEAFYGATALKGIYIPASVSVIAADAFAFCPSITSIVVDSANTYYKSNNSDCIVEIDNINYQDKLIAGCVNTVIYKGIKEIGEYAFVGCVDLKTLNIPSSVTEIREGAFYGCTSLSEIKVDANNGKYLVVDNCLIIPHEMRLVQGCKSSVISEEYEIDGETKQLLSISKHAFAGCTGITEIYIPSTVESLAAGSFDGCTSLNKIVVANDELVLNGDVFSGCAAIDDITIPMSLLDYFIGKSKDVLKNVALTTGDSIKDGCFANSASLTTVSLPATVAEIGNYAFGGCKALVKVTIASGSVLNTIGHNAFDGCESFKEIALETETVDEYAVFTVPATVETIGNYAFRGCAIEALDFAENGRLTAIDYKVFADCVSLNELSIPSYINTVDFDAFYGCANLKKVSIPSEFVRSLSNAKGEAGYPVIETLEITSGDCISRDCYYIREMKDLKTLVIGKDVTDIDNRVFEGCSKLETITVAEGNTKYSSVGNCLIEDGETLILGSVSCEIPATVKTIASYAFAQSDVPAVVIPETVTLVEEFAFSSCRSLAEITIESSATVIALKAFDGSDGIKTAVIPSSAIPYISQVSLESVKITEGRIPAGAFKNCVTLTAVEVSAGVELEDETVFAGCKNIISITAPVTILAGFSELQLEELGINSVDAAITKEFIDNFKDIKSLYLLASDEEYDIASNAFASCVNIEIADVPAWALSKIPASNIRKLTVNSGSKLSGSISLPMLEEVELGASVTDIDASVFKSSSKLSSITVDEDNNAYGTEGNCLLDGSKVVLGALGAVLPEAVTEIGDYAFAGRTDIGAVTLHEGITSIGKYAFYGCTTLTVESFPETLETIGERAFNSCSSLTKVVLTNGNTSIGNYAFASCYGITEIQLPEGVAVGTNAFMLCTSVTSASVPASAIKHLPGSSIETLNVIAGELNADNTIIGFDALTSLIIGKNVTVVTADAVTGVNNLTSIVVDGENADYTSDGNCVISADKHLVLGCGASVLPNDGSVEYIDAYAFRGCVSLTELVIPASVTYIDPFAFYGCTGIESISVAADNSVYRSEGNCVIDKATNTVVLGCKSSEIPADVTAIGDYAFNGVSGLSAIEIPESVTKIGKYAFAYTGVTEFRLPTSVTEIDESAFQGCAYLKRFIVLEGSSLETIGAHAFKSCVQLEVAVIPGTITAIADDAFDNRASGIKIYWYGTSGDYNSDLPLNRATVVYFSKTNNPGCWHYEDEGRNVAVW